MTNLHRERPARSRVPRRAVEARGRFARASEGGTDGGQQPAHVGRQQRQALERTRQKRARPHRTGGGRCGGEFGRQLPRQRSSELDAGERRRLEREPQRQEEGDGALGSVRAPERTAFARTLLRSYRKTELKSWVPVSAGTSVGYCG